jgi:hypothetical protein
MDLSKALENLKYDVRMRDWNVRQGLSTEQAQLDHLNGLKDLTPQSVPLTFQEEDSSDYEQ